MHRFADIYSSGEQREHLCINIQVCAALIVRVLLVFRAPEIITKLEKHGQRKVDCFTDSQNSLYVAVVQTVIVVFNETLQSYSPSAVSLLVRRISYLKRKEKDKESEKAYAGMPTQEERGRSENTKHTIVFRDFIKPCTLRSKSFMTRKGERVTRIEIRGESWYLFRRKPFVRLAIVFWYLTLAVTAASRSRRWKIYMVG